MHGKPVNAGISLYQIYVGKFIQIRKMALLKQSAISPKPRQEFISY